MRVQQNRPAEALRWGLRAVYRAPFSAVGWNCLARAHQSLGAVEQASACLKRAIILDPAHSFAYLQFRLLMEQAEKHAQAFDFALLSVKLMPDCSEAQARLADFYGARGEAGLAQRHARLALLLSPERAESWLDDASLRQNLANAAGIERDFRYALRIDPSLAMAYFSIAKSFKAQNRIGDSLREIIRALILAPHYFGYYKDLAEDLAIAGENSAAIQTYLRCIVLEPELPESRFDLALLQERSGDPVAAMRQFRLSLLLQPDHTGCYNNICTLHSHKGHVAEARVDVARAVFLAPERAIAHRNLGILLDCDQDAVGAIHQFRLALLIDPEDARNYNQLGVLLSQAGQLVQARLCLGRAILLSPDCGAYRRNLTEITPAAAALPLFDTLHAQLKRGDALSEEDQIEVNFALGKLYDETGQHQRAFAHWADANRAMRRRIAYDETAHLSQLLQRAALYRAFVTKAAPSLDLCGDPSEELGVRPIFIVGMPRCGSSLLEQMIGMDETVYCCGEVGIFGRLAEQAGLTEGAPPPALPQARALGREYLARLGRIAGRAPIVIDKDLSNFDRIGLIRMALPQARFIHLRRDPVDSCMSSYARHFSAGHLYSYDLGELGRYHNVYRRVMTDWQGCLSEETLMGLNYEDLIRDPVLQTRRIFDFVGIPWTASCLAFHEKQRNVKTASLMQIRQPLNQEGLGRWLVYRPYIGELLTALGAFSVAAE